MDERPSIEEASQERPKSFQEEKEHESLREEVMFLRKTIISIKNNEVLSCKSSYQIMIA